MMLQLFFEDGAIMFFWMLQIFSSCKLMNVARNMMQMLREDFFYPGFDLQRRFLMHILNVTHVDFPVLQLFSSYVTNATF
jgi:hypothetical protein